LGGNNILTDEFYTMVQKIIKKSKWSADDIRFLNMCYNDNLGYLVYLILQKKADHPLFSKYYHDKHFDEPTIKVHDVHYISNELKNGELNIEDLNMFKLKTLNEFAK